MSGVLVQFSPSSNLSYKREWFTWSFTWQVNGSISVLYEGMGWSSTALQTGASIEIVTGYEFISHLVYKPLALVLCELPLSRNWRLVLIDASGRCCRSQNQCVISALQYWSHCKFVYLPSMRTFSDYFLQNESYDYIESSSRSIKDLKI